MTDKLEVTVKLDARDAIKAINAAKVRSQQATIFAALEGLTPEEMLAPVADRLDELDGSHTYIHSAKAHLAQAIYDINRYLVSTGK